MLLQWISDNIQIITIILTLILAVSAIISAMIAIFSARTTRKLLLLNSQPSVNIDFLDIELIPEINFNDKFNIEDFLHENEERYCINLKVKLSNTGNNIAQRLCLDGCVYFNTVKPYKLDFLPVHLPEYINILSPYKTNEKDSTILTSVRFDNFIAKQIMLDFYSKRKKSKGSPYLPFENELIKTKEYPSPRLLVNCYYSDIQGTEYCSSQYKYFHMYSDYADKKIKISLINMGDLEYANIKQISGKKRAKIFRTLRHLRYTAFDGKLYRKNDLIFLCKSSKNPSND